jgi:hypothetical protein
MVYYKCHGIYNYVNDDHNKKDMSGIINGKNLSNNEAWTIKVSIYLLEVLSTKLIL